MKTRDAISADVAVGLGGTVHNGPSALEGARLLFGLYLDVRNKKGPLVFLRGDLTAKQLRYLREWLKEALATIDAVQVNLDLAQDARELLQAEDAGGAP